MPSGFASIPLVKMVNLSLLELFIDDFDEIYDNQEADEDVTRDRIGRKILDFLASL